MRRLKKWMAVKGENGNFIAEWDKVKFKKDDKPDPKGHVRIRIELVGNKHTIIAGNKVGTFHIWDATVGEVANIIEKSLEFGADLKQSHVLEYEGTKDKRGRPYDPGMSVRDEEMRELRRKGFTYAQLGDKYGISKQRVQVICCGVEVEHRKKAVKKPRRKKVVDRAVKKARRKKKDVAKNLKRGKDGRFATKSVA